MAEHTPGPWVVVPNNGAYVKQDKLATLRIEERRSADELVLALIITDCERCRDAAEANARLIAAAPSLLAACKVALQAMMEMVDPDCVWCIGGEDSPVDEPLRHDADCPITSIRAAVSRAEGRSNA